jgi:hypothetical protein
MTYPYLAWSGKLLAILCPFIAVFPGLAGARFSRLAPL